MFDIAVIGCGPAATITAIGLQRLGYSVVVIGRVRKLHVVEGISERVYQALQQQGLHQAVQQVSDPVPRYACWNGENNNANHERLIDRQQFDTALIDELQTAGVSFRSDTVVKVDDQDNCWCIRTRSGELMHARFLAEARGRSAPLGKTDCLRGPETVSLGQLWQIPEAAHAAMTQVITTENGWLWVARLKNGQCFTQCSIHATSETTPSKQNTRQFLQQQLNSHPLTEKLLNNAIPMGECIARSSTPVLVKQPIGINFIRIGDAAMAVDPLSGNGIFQSLSSALSAPSVINTILAKPESTALAMQFYRDRINHLFYRFCRLGRDFYRMETQWQNAPFWSARNSWPDNLPAHPDQDRIVGKEMRPVLNQNFIELKEVVITTGQPLGIWKVGNIPATDFFRKTI